MKRAELREGKNVVNDSVANSLKGLKILVIDDSKTIRRTAETLLTKEGCQVFTAIDGFDALSIPVQLQPAGQRGLHAHG